MPGKKGVSPRFSHFGSLNAVSFLNRAWARMVGMPWVYERLRITLLGGGPAGKVFGWLGDTRDDVLIDIGCGTGMALDRLGPFAEYHGFDTDARALGRFRQRDLPGNVHLYNAKATGADLDRIRPTKAILMGLLHHLPDMEAGPLLSMLADCPSLRCAITLDPVLTDGKPLNNLLCRLDRGRHVRTRNRYEMLATCAGLVATQNEALNSGNGFATYYCSLVSTENQSVENQSGLLLPGQPIVQ
jgi:SAM-dependent methyltransferase